MAVPPDLRRDLRENLGRDNSRDCDARLPKAEEMADPSDPTCGGNSRFCNNEMSDHLQRMGRQLEAIEAQHQQVRDDYGSNVNCFLPETDVPRHCFAPVQFIVGRQPDRENLAKNLLGTRYLSGHRASQDLEDEVSMHDSQYWHEGQHDSPQRVH